MENKKVLLEARHLVKEFPIGGTKKNPQLVHAVSDVNLDIYEGETLALVGESGCGKSVTSLSIMQLLKDTPGKVTNGSATLDGVNLVEASDTQIRDIRGGKMSMIFQEPMSALNPSMRIDKQMIETIRLHQDMTKEQALAHAADMLKKVGIPDPARVLKNYPHQLSGGMSQRVMIAMALSNNPELLIADEPTTALDVTIQAQILDLMNELRESYDASVIMITHDLGVIAETCEQVAVFYAGQVVEQASVDAIFHHTAHPYTSGLLRSVTSLGGEQKELYTIRGTVPTAGQFSSGCRFADRCEHCMTRCREAVPPLTEAAPGHQCRCWLHTGGTEKEAAR